MSEAAPEFVGALALGRMSDPSALALLRKDGPGREARYTLMVLRRYELRTPYPAIVADAGGALAAARTDGVPLVLDVTGIGRPVGNLAREWLTHAWVVPVTITAGHAAAETPDGWNVPKKELVSALALVHTGRRLIVPAKLAHGKTLAREMENFKVKITLAAAAGETVEAWREGLYDDLVFAVALAVWWGERFSSAPFGPPSHLAARTLTSRTPEGVFETDRLRDLEPGACRRKRGDDDGAGFGGGLQFPDW